MSTENVVPATRVHDVVLLPCPFCGSSDIEPPNRHSVVFRLKHNPNCFIGVKDWKSESWFTPGSDEFERWNSRVSPEFICDRCSFRQDAKPNVDPQF